MKKFQSENIGTYHGFVSAFTVVSHSYDCIFTLLIQNVYDVDIGQILDKFCLRSHRSVIGKPNFDFVGIGRYRSANFWKMTSLV